ncbi:hypothetical protein ND861_12465 [Leptospira sp. 2 VSF19]|uniref:Uncharacterized protein n=1 Tax=Leptospira soteropolitanensis TaxID=2950025 RepID=A0AAW5VN43_9LEPT|nr:hypothetical protein [Leptospira soteropolitanensis]MCW7493453.1 hypothetical protein [Leptospira soteropolitanensis]MCW7501015.1 hypothetical protein [Leptospira soteropolitanensis]MCW7523305.1 hypothetical protein [Leptospira soteropolitanensis]MCW7527166.1 hypothetical protein [Leptospira soteropolitanensis]MCW7531023.1 hypothetical protein [Leptospira soteropolitanensis]
MFRTKLTDGQEFGKEINPTATDTRLWENEGQKRNPSHIERGFYRK